MNLARNACKRDDNDEMAMVDTHWIAPDLMLATSTPGQVPRCQIFLHQTSGLPEKLVGVALNIVEAD